MLCRLLTSTTTSAARRSLTLRPLSTLPYAFTPAQRSEALAILPRWEDAKDAKGKDAIQQVYTFADFSQAWAFMSRSALLAEKLDHHPEVRFGLEIIGVWRGAWLGKRTREGLWG